MIQGRDFTCVAETVNTIESWLGSLPGHVYANVRQPLLSTRNLAHMTPLSAVWAGERNAHLDGPPLLFAKTEGATPFRLSLHVAARSVPRRGCDVCLRDGANPPATLQPKRDRGMTGTEPKASRLASLILPCRPPDAGGLSHGSHSVGATGGFSAGQFQECQ